jgi:hypothetical protein
LSSRDSDPIVAKALVRGARAGREKQSASNGARGRLHHACSGSQLVASRVAPLLAWQKNADHAGVVVYSSRASASSRSGRLSRNLWQSTRSAFRAERVLVAGSRMLESQAMREAWVWALRGEGECGVRGGELFSWVAARLGEE